MALRKLTSRASLSNAYHPGCPVWVPEKAQGPDGAFKAARWLKGRVVRLTRSPEGLGLLEVGWVCWLAAQGVRYAHGQFCRPGTSLCSMAARTNRQGACQA